MKLQKGSEAKHGVDGKHDPCTAISLKGKVGEESPQQQVNGAQGLPPNLVPEDFQAGITGFDEQNVDPSEDRNARQETEKAQIKDRCGGTEDREECACADASDQEQKQTDGEEARVGHIF